MTVNELIIELGKYHPDNLVVIDDADTNWLLHITEVKESHSVVMIGGSYMEIKEK